MLFIARVTPILLNLLVKANILIDRTGCARLADFGLLTIISNPRYLLSSSSQTQGGTVRWMSPERIAPDRFGFKNSRPTISSDCYSLGMVIYETISGNLPFHKDTDPAVFMKIVEGKHPPRGVSFTKSLWGMLERCWASRPSDRPSIEDVLLCLEMASNSSDPPSPRPIEGVDEDDDDWDSATNSSGGDSVDFFATEDHTQLLPISTLQDRHLADSRRASLPPRYAPSASSSGVGNLPPPVFDQVKRPYTPDLPPPVLNQNTTDSDSAYNNTFSNYSGSTYSPGQVFGSTLSSNLLPDSDLDLSNLSGFSAHDIAQLSAAFGFDSYSSFPDNSPTMPPPPVFDQIKRPYTPDSPPPVSNQNKRQKFTLDSSTTNNHQEPPRASSLGHTNSLPTLYSENSTGFSDSHRSHGVAPIRSAYHHSSSPHLTSFQFPPSADQDNKFHLRVDTTFNPYTSYSNSSTPNSFFLPTGSTSLLSPPSQPVTADTNFTLLETLSEPERIREVHVSSLVEMKIQESQGSSTEKTASSMVGLIAGEHLSHHKLTNGP